MVQEFHGKFTLAPAKLYYINNLKQELSMAKAYEQNLLDEKSVVDRHQCHMTAKFDVFVYEDYSKLSALVWVCLIMRNAFFHF